MRWVTKENISSQIHLGKKNTPPWNRAAKLPSLQKTIKQTHFFPQPVSQNTNVLPKAYNSGRAHTLALWGGILIKAVVSLKHAVLIYDV